MDLNPLHLIKHGAQALAGLPGKAFHASEQAVGSLLPDQLVLTTQLPPYRKLPPGALDAARARSAGLKVPQAVSYKTPGSVCEPVTLEVHGSLEQLERALAAQGWDRGDKLSLGASAKVYGVLAWNALGLNHLHDMSYDKAPMTRLFIDGKPMVAGFEKNNVHHHGRDHLRVFDTGRKDAQGRPILQVTASRDLNLHLRLPNLTTGHGIDHNLDPERDQVMADLIASGVKDWRVAKGQLPAADQAGVNAAFQTDGNVYVVNL